MSSFGDVNARIAPCPSCGREQRVTTKYVLMDSWDDDELGIDGTNEYYVFQCNGCETYFFCKSSSCSEFMVISYSRNGKKVSEFDFRKTYWPSIPENKFTKLATTKLESKTEYQDLFRILNETYKAIENGLPILAAVGIRTSFDSASAILGIDANLPFAEKLEELRTRHFIGGKDKGALAVLVDAGGAAAHRAWVPTDEVLETLVEVLNNFIEANILRPEKLKRVREQIPSRK